MNDKVKVKTLVDDQTNPIKRNACIVIFLLLMLHFIGVYISFDKLIAVQSWIDLLIDTFNNIAIAFPIIKSLIQPLTWWLVLMATSIYGILYIFATTQQHHRTHNNPEYSDVVNAIMHWFIRLKDVLWIAFFAINLFFIANQHVWPMFFDFVKR